MGRAVRDLGIYTKQNQFQHPGGRHLPAGIEKRKAPKGIWALERLEMSTKDRQIARMVNESRSYGTSKAHSRVIALYQRFIELKGYDMKTVTADLMTQFLLDVEDQKRPYSFCNQIKGALFAYMVALQLNTCLWTCLCQRILEGMLRRSAVEKRPKQKANPLPGTVITKMMEKYILQAESVDRIPLVEARTILLLILQFHNLSRCGDIHKLRACDLQLCLLQGRNAIKVTYRSAKNDVQYESRDGFIVEEPGNDLCPVKVIKMIYTRMGVYFNDGITFDKNFLLARTRSIKVDGVPFLVSDGRFQVSISTLAENIKKLARDVGYMEPVSTKSAKVSGCSAGFDAGLDDAAMRDKGKWKGLETAQHYRVLSESHRLRLAAATSLSGQGPSGSSHKGRVHYPVQSTRDPRGQTRGDNGSVDRLAARVGEQLNVSPSQLMTGGRSHQDRIREQAHRQREVLIDPIRPRSVEEMHLGIGSRQESAQLQDEFCMEPQEDSQPRRVWVTTLYIDDALMHTV